MIPSFCPRFALVLRQAQSARRDDAALDLAGPARDRRRDGLDVGRAVAALRRRPVRAAQELAVEAAFSAEESGFFFTDTQLTAAGAPESVILAPGPSLGSLIPPEESLESVTRLSQFAGNLVSEESDFVPTFIDPVFQPTLAERREESGIDFFGTFAFDPDEF